MGGPSTAAGDPATSVVIDATKCPGIELVATFLPAAAVPGGVRRVAARQWVAAIVAIPFGELLPISWLASVQRTGDIAANEAAYPYAGPADRFVLGFGDLAVAHEDGAWRLPHYDSNEYRVAVGFGLGRGAVRWGYSVPCRPGETLAIDAGAYQLARWNGQEQVGDPIAEHVDGWTLPLGYSYTLIFDERGNGVLARA